eukprot:XP_001709386.1 Hypothetical protein GL50803_31964 [Giardia lamblia ATCC 50803]
MVNIFPAPLPPNCSRKSLVRGSFLLVAKKAPSATKATAVTPKVTPATIILKNQKIQKKLTPTSFSHPQSCNTHRSDDGAAGKSVLRCISSSGGVLWVPLSGQEERDRGIYCSACGRHARGLS